MDVRGRSALKCWMHCSTAGRNRRLPKKIIRSRHSDLIRTARAPIRSEPTVQRPRPGAELRLSALGLLMEEDRYGG